MPYSVKILKDSIGPEFVFPNGFSGGTPSLPKKSRRKRITTWELSYPRMVHAELLTHKLLSRNSASSRAIPNAKLRDRVFNDPAMPVWWGKNQPGMQAREELSNERDFSTKACPRHNIGPHDNYTRDRCDDCVAIAEHGYASPMEKAKREWILSRDYMLRKSEHLAEIGLHKQICNRLIEPWMFITVIVTATEWDNFFHLRDHKDAQPEIAFIATEMHKQYLASVPEELAAGEWHLPMIDDEDREWARSIEKHDPSASAIEMLKQVSTGRVARVSYLTHDGVRDPREDMELHNKLCLGPTLDPPQPGHWSPFEHPAQALTLDQWNQRVGEELHRATDSGDFFDHTVLGNVIGWKQYRKEFDEEHFRGVQS